MRRRDTTCRDSAPRISRLYIFTIVSVPPAVSSSAFRSFGYIYTYTYIFVYTYIYIYICLSFEGNNLRSRSERILPSAPSDYTRSSHTRTGYFRSAFLPTCGKSSLDTRGSIPTIIAVDVRQSPRAYLKATRHFRAAPAATAV